MKVLILGIDGFMGKLIGKLAIESNMSICGGITIPGSKNIGMDIGTLLGFAETGLKVQDSTDLANKVNASSPDCVIDFSVAEATEKNIPPILELGIPCVIGTTGLSQAFKDKVLEICKRKNLSTVISSNMATGVNIFFELSKYIAQMIKEHNWDVEIIEKHHNRKKDSPSGTAITIAEKVAEGLDIKLEDSAVYGRNKGFNPRKPGKAEIGIHAIRAGDIVGEHTVILAGQGERIEITHQAHSRECFAKGTIVAAQFINKHKNEGKLFDMQDVLGTKKQ